MCSYAIIQKQKQFLINCGFDMSNGFWDDDYQLYRKEYQSEHLFVFGYK